MEDALEIIRDAINNHLQLVFRYNGYPREACPHLLGRKDGVWHSLMWQFGGDTSQLEGLPDGGTWRCFEVRDINGLASQPGEWFRGYETGRGEQHCVERIDTSVDQNHRAEFRPDLAKPRKPRRAPSRLGRRKLW